MINAKFPELFTPPVFWYANMAFTIFAIIYLLLSIYIFATYLEGENQTQIKIYLRPNANWCKL